MAFGHALISVCEIFVEYRNLALTLVHYLTKQAVERAFASSSSTMSLNNNVNRN